MHQACSNRSYKVCCERAWRTQHSLQLFCPVSVLCFVGYAFRADLLNSGITDTPMLHQSASIRGNELKLDHLALKRKGQASEVAKLIEFLLSDASSYMTGTVQSIDGGWHC